MPPTRLTRASPRPEAGGIGYDNTDSGLDADTIQEAIDELAEGGVLDIDASDVRYDNSASGLTADDVQEAIDELADALDWSVDTVGSLTAGGSPQTIVNDSAHNVFPGLARLDASRVLCVFRRGTDHLTGGDLYGSIGTLAANNASVTSWTFPFLIYSHATLDVRCEDSVSIVDDRLVIAARLYDGTDNQSPFIIICDDAPSDFTSSSTWGSPISIPLSTGSDQNYTQGHVHKLANGTYLLGVGWDSAGLHAVGVAHSADLDDWSAATFDTVASGADDFAEVAIEEFPDGDLRALVRSVTDGNIQTSTSADGGDTWSAVAAGYDGYGYPAFRHLLSTLTLTVYRDAPNGDNAWRSSTNEGSTWGSETILDTTGTRSAYASILQLTPTKVLVAYAIEYSVDGSTGTADIFAQIFTDSSTFSPNVGGSIALDDLTDVTITSPVTGALLQYNGSVWVDVAAESVGHYEVLMDGSSPPNPLENGSGTDWLYVWVP